MIVEARAVGQRDAVLAPHYVDVVATGRLTLAELIDQVVRAELAAADGSAAEGAALLQLFCPAGLVCSELDADVTVTTALQAFGGGVYFAIVDGVQVHDLDTVLSVGPATRLRFLRPLAQAAG